MQRQEASSGSDTDPRYANVDERKRKRMISNRESARRSRMRKQKQMEDLVNEVSNLQNENCQLRQRINLASERYIEVKSAKNVLRAQAMELTERLRSLSSVLQIVEDVSGLALDIPEIPDPLLKPLQLPCPVSGLALDIPEIPDPLLKPLQLPCPVQPIMASVDMFLY